MQLKKNVPCVLVQEKFELNYIENTQEVCLWNENGDGGRNNVLWRKIIENSGDLNLEGKSISKILYDEYFKTFPDEDIKYVKLDYEKELQKRDDKIKNLGKELQQRSEKLNDKIKSIYNSKSYKIGRVMTFVPRKIRGGIRCCKEHGILYTFKRGLKCLLLIR